MLRRTLPVLLLACSAAVLAPLPPLRDAAAKGGAADVEPVEKDFEVAYASPDAPTRAKAVDSLTRATDPVKFRLVVQKVFPKEDRADVLARGVSILGSIKDPATQDALVKATRTASGDRKVLQIEALARMSENSGAHTYLFEALKDKDTYVRAMAAWALGEHQAADAIDPLLACLGDGKWQVQSAALAAFPRIRDKEALRTKALPKLVEYLENSVGRQRDDCADAMRRITSKNLGKDPDLWRKWIAGGDAALPAAGADGAPKPSGGAYGNQAEKPHFYGIDVVSHRAVIILDISLSMNEPIEIDKDRLRRETSRRKVITGEGADASKKPQEEDDRGYDIPWWRIKSRLDLARYQAINLISKLDPEQSFELILFSTKVTPWMNKLVPANQANKQKAIAMIEAIQPEEQTNTFGALAAAFELSEKDARGSSLGPDEIFLVTDGAPSVGDIKEPQEILEAVLQMAKIQQCRINVIGVGVDLQFLRKLASATGGQSKMFK